MAFLDLWGLALVKRSTVAVWKRRVRKRIGVGLIVGCLGWGACVSPEAANSAVLVQGDQASEIVKIPNPYLMAFAPEKLTAHFLEHYGIVWPEFWAAEHHDPWGQLITLSVEVEVPLERQETEVERTLYNFFAPSDLALNTWAKFSFAEKRAVREEKGLQSFRKTVDAESSWSRDIHAESIGAEFTMGHFKTLQATFEAIELADKMLPGRLGFQIHVTATYSPSDLKKSYKSWVAFAAQANEWAFIVHAAQAASAANRVGSSLVGPANVEKLETVYRSLEECWGLSSDCLANSAIAGHQPPTKYWAVSVRAGIYDHLDQTKRDPARMGFEIRAGLDQSGSKKDKLTWIAAHTVLVLKNSTNELFKLKLGTVGAPYLLRDVGMNRTTAAWRLGEDFVSKALKIYPNVISLLERYKEFETHINEALLDRFPDKIERVNLMRARTVPFQQWYALPLLPLAERSYVTDNKAKKTLQDAAQKYARRVEAAEAQDCARMDDVPFDQLLTAWARESQAAMLAYLWKPF